MSLWRGRPLNVGVVPSARLCLTRHLVIMLCLSRSLSVNAEPFDHAPQPVPLDLLDLPPGLTHLELRNIDVISQPADLAAAAAPYPSFSAAAAAAAAAPAASAQPQKAAGLGVSIGLGGGRSCSGSSDGGGVERCSSCSTSDGGGGARGMLQHLESFKLESCRLRAAQLQVGLKLADTHPDSHMLTVCGVCMTCHWCHLCTLASDMLWLQCRRCPSSSPCSSSHALGRVEEGPVHWNHNSGSLRTPSPAGSFCACRPCVRALPACSS